VSPTVELAKLHATGNDFLVWSRLDRRRSPAVDPAAYAAALCDRHRGIGADGLLVLDRGADGADATMTLLNADGGIAEMSGNGIRCLVWAAVRGGAGHDGRVVVDTGAGRRVVDVECDPVSGEVAAATADMGPVTFDPPAIPLDAPSPFGLTEVFHGVEYEGDAAGMGNPHWVLFVDDPATAYVTRHGPHLEHDPRFPNRTNVEFVAPLAGARETLRMRVWERGVGETLSCGTGACAAAAVAHHRGVVGERVTVRVPGGELRVELGETVRLGGPVRHVFDVTVDLDRLGAEPGGQP
jgi:diaminopimelate epimerase